MLSSHPYTKGPTLPQILLEILQDILLEIQLEIQLDIMLEILPQILLERDTMSQIVPLEATFATHIYIADQFAPDSALQCI